MALPYIILKICTYKDIYTIFLDTIKTKKAFSLNVASLKRGNIT